MPIVVTAVALPFYVLWAELLATAGGDLAAQFAWTEFMARHPGSAYNLSWYGGMHIFNYSVLAPVAMALFGVRTVSVAAGLAGTWVMAALFVRAKVRHAVWPALLGALALWCNVASGRTTFALGAAVGLLALLTLLSPDRSAARVVGAVLAGLSTLASPVAGAFLVVAGAAYLLDRQWMKAASLIVPPLLLTGAVMVLFPFRGEQPMPLYKVWMPLALCAALWWAAPRGWQLVRYAAAAYAVGVVVAFSVASPIGANVDRLAGFAGPPVLLAALLTRRPIRAPRQALPPVLLAAALASCTGWVLSNTHDDLATSNSLQSCARHTDGVITALDRLRADRTRVEVVPARNHREAYLLAPHINMARGWNRQLDVERGRLFYDGTFSAEKYRAWLDRWAVGLVVLPAGRPDGPATAEAALVRNPPAWLKPVWRDNGWAIYRVQDAVPLVSAPATELGGNDAELIVRMPSAGTVTVRIAYSPWLSAPGACIERAGDWTQLTVHKRGDYRLGSDYHLP
ncbi:hypothetical protein ABZS83_04645 [Streptomyces sp. NPDC005426]|uniref:hypothetical protein n=1 Tax=Streptomyces sp. NPDC005426 TaxID=3155344 RepID=UPI0033B6B747